MKAAYSIFVTELGMSIDCKEAQPKKAPRPIFVTEPGILTEVTDLFFMPLRIEPVSSKIKIGSVMVIMDFVYAKVMKITEQ